jgi:hypothetical protein
MKIMKSKKPSYNNDGVRKQEKGNKGIMNNSNMMYFWLVG